MPPARHTIENEICNITESISVMMLIPFSKEGVEMTYTLQGYYSDEYGWEDLISYSEENGILAVGDLVVYNMNEPEYPHRIVKKEEEKEV